MTYPARLQRLLDGIHKYRDRLVCAIVHLNDTYLIDERPRRLPGFPRLIATLNELRERVIRETGNDRLVVVHSGDFLGPSRVGKKYRGSAMVELLNRCRLSYCVLGNHEFDYKSSNLIAQLKMAKFDVLSCNVTIPAGVKTCAIALWSAEADPLVAFTGVVSRSVHRSFDSDWTFTRATGALLRFCERTQSVPFHVVLSHATRNQDRIMRKALTKVGRTVILGGHDHHIDWGEFDTEPALYKNRANLETVRVLLLLAGGDFAMRQLNGSYKELKRRKGSHPTFDESDVEEILKSLHERDADVFRRWIEKGSDVAQEAATPIDYFDDDDDLPGNSLARRLAGMPLLRDVWSHVLQYEDFLQPASVDADWVTSIMAGIKEPDEDIVLFDFSACTPRLDARDEGLRATPTDFGLWVAECVRREGTADIAIINAGAFRCDSYLDSVLAKRDLLDAFLYDDAGPGGELPIIIIEMEHADVEALLAHGRSRLDEGSYPQVADRRDPSKREHRVAISSYVLLNEKSIDGYVEVLASLHGRTNEEIRDGIRGAVLGAFRIVPAILKHGAAVGYKDPPPVVFQQDDATTFVRLAKNVSVAFDRMLPYETVTPVSWNESFRRVFSDKNMTLDSEVQNARDELRTFLGSIPSRSMKRFIQEIQKHPANWADGMGYLDIFKAASYGVPSLQTYRD
jgi:hypothetical protein